MAISLLLSVGDGLSSDHLDLQSSPYKLVNGTLDTTRPGRVAFTLWVESASADTLAADVSALQHKLNQARAASVRGVGTWVTLGVQLGMSSMVFYDILRGAIVVPAVNHAGVRIDSVHRIQVPVELETLPYARGAAVDAGTTEGLTGEAGHWLLEDVTGDMPALVRLEITGQSVSVFPNRVRIGRRAGKNLALTDFDPWVDVAALTGATDTGDVTAFGDSYATRTVTSTDWSDLARAVMPAGALNQGRFDIWGRLWDSAAVLSTPTGLAGTVNAPAGASAINREQLVTGNNGAGSASVSASLAATDAGNLLYAAVTTRNEVSGRIELVQNVDSAGSSLTPNPGGGLNTTVEGNTLMAFVACAPGVNILAESGWTEMGRIDTHPTGCDIVGFYQLNAAPLSSVTFDLNISGAWVCVFHEYSGIAAVGALINVGFLSLRTDTDFGAVEVGTVVAKGEVLLLVASAQSAGSGHTGWTGGFVETNDRNFNANNSGLGIATQIVTASNYYFTQVDTVNGGVTTDWSMFGVAFKAEDVVPPEVAITPPSGWAEAATAINYDDPAAPLKTSEFFRQDAPSVSGSQAFTMTPDGSAELVIAEYSGIDPNAALDVSGGRKSAGSTTTAVSTDGVAGQGDVLVLGAFGAFDAPSYTLSGLTEIADSGGLAVGELITDIRQSHNATATASTASTFANAIAVFRAIMDDTEPGSLEPGSHGFRVQAADQSGNRSNATATNTETMTVDGSAIALSWASGGGSPAYYVLSWSDPDGVVREILTTATNYTLTEPDDGRIISALPSTTGATATPARIQLKIGTAGTDSSDLLALPAVTLSAESMFGDVLLGSSRDLPPVGASIDGERPEWAAEAQIASGNGESATVRLDALWLAAHDEPQAAVEFPGLDLASNHRWVIETDRRGRGLVCWLEDPSDDSEVGQLKPTGTMLLEGGADNILALLLEIAGGASDLAVEVDVSVTYWPRWRWQAST